ncbi:hypothetical protein [Anaerorhabdus furcosa]|uniref:CAAX protease self-immunity n=1 Tax=Anaerorhabdus furcosa TaxID=118967 RepID=A0A1T4N5Z3_9FIRM|nr:hypothetical protein [Anaerorhabdus furcosa]SJZ74288.1 hypothetical protein SAMN02745191_1484 [Anaerorhabdus furcosa]
MKGIKWDYLNYAMLAFLGLGLEMGLLLFVEPFIFSGTITSQYSSLQKIIHWVATMFLWVGMIVYIIVDLKKVKKFDVFNYTKPSYKGIVVSIILVIICIGMNYYDWHTLKIMAEFQSKSFILFLFQYLYYFVEIGLVLLILICGQAFFEENFQQREGVPYGGLVLCFTWGIVHYLSKGSLSTAMAVMIYSILFGLIYTNMKKNTLWTYLLILLAFII